MEGLEDSGFRQSKSKGAEIELSIVCVPENGRGGSGQGVDLKSVRSMVAGRKSARRC